MAPTDALHPISPTMPRRRFLVTAAAAAAGLMAWSPAMTDPSGSGPPAPMDEPAPPAESDRDDLFVRGSPRLLSTHWSPTGPASSWTGSEARLVHFHLPAADRDRLLLGLP